MDSLSHLTKHLEQEIEDPEEETFLLYSQQIPSLSLGFIDPRASEIEVTVSGHDFTIHQSPSVLSSNRSGGTTGAVIWKITPTFASWLASPSNPLFTSGALSNEPHSSSFLELGCGISPLSALGLASRAARYVLTDQPYVQRLLQRNLDENLPSAVSSSAPGSGARSRGKKRGGASTSTHGGGSSQASIRFATLDWETDQVTPSLTGSDSVRSFDAVVACDCVYNYALVAPFVQTCADACRLRIQDSSHDNPCLCVIGQQLRNDEVFESWLKAFHTSFHVWRVPDAALPEELRSSAGFVVHVGILRDHVKP